MTNRGTITLVALLLTGAGAGAALAGQTSPGLFWLFREDTISAR